MSLNSMPTGRGNSVGVSGQQNDLLCQRMTTRHFAAFYWDGTWYLLKTCHKDEGILAVFYFFYAGIHFIVKVGFKYCIL